MTYLAIYLIGLIAVASFLMYLNSATKAAFFVSDDVKAHNPIPTKVVVWFSLGSWFTLFCTLAAAFALLFLTILSENPK